MKYPVPRTHVPKVDIICIKCKSAGTFIKMASPHTDGYVRRHMCRDDKCGYSFYSRAPYKSGEVEISPLPFKDRPMSEIDIYNRDQMWIDSDDMNVTLKVTDDPFMHQLIDAMATEEGKRTPRHNTLLHAFNYLKQKLEIPDAD